MTHCSQPKPLEARKSTALHGEVRVPGDKSISHRALILGALAVAGAAPSTDVDDSLGQLGKHFVADEPGSTWWLGDSIGVPSSGVVVSPGDLAMLAGIVSLTVAGSAGFTRSSRVNVSKPT